MQLTAIRDCGVEGLEFSLFSVSDGIDWPPLPAWEHLIHHSRIALKRLLGLNQIKIRVYSQFLLIFPQDKFYCYGRPPSQKCSLFIEAKECTICLTWYSKVLFLTWFQTLDWNWLSNLHWTIHHFLLTKDIQMKVECHRVFFRDRNRCHPKFKFTMWYLCTINL